ncbi:hypothetical protein FRC04_009001 [Tulasnella sp. 424]|nr:hypothetical protein FRC04_009001 [Tulasnella sp. 424]
MKIPHGGYTPDELAEFRPAIYTDLVDLAKDIIWTMRKIDVDFVEEINRVRQILRILSPLTFRPLFNPDLPSPHSMAHLSALSANALFNDPAQQQNPTVHTFPPRFDRQMQRKFSNTK